MLKRSKIFFFVLLVLQQTSVNAAVINNNKDSLTFDLNRVKASVSLTDMKNVHRDYIHQEIYVDELLNEMNKDLDQNINLPQIQSIAEDINAISSGGSVGATLLSLGPEQDVYYIPPIDSEAEILGRKAVGTAIFEQYTVDLLNTFNQKLTKLDLGNIDQFIDANKVEYSKLHKLTTQYYTQASKVHRVAMDAGFVYEQYLLAHFSSSLKKFYKKAA